MLDNGQKKRRRLPLPSKTKKLKILSLENHENVSITGDTSMEITQQVKQNEPCFRYAAYDISEEPSNRII